MMQHIKRSSEVTPKNKTRHEKRFREWRCVRCSGERIREKHTHKLNTRWDKRLKHKKRKTASGTGKSPTKRNRTEISDNRRPKQEEKQAEEEDDNEFNERIG